MEGVFKKEMQLTSTLHCLKWYLLLQVQTLSKVHHKNLVALVGYCQNKKCLALVYDFMPRGNLQQLLRGGFTLFLFTFF
jgi:serine/threonine protein kinase